MKAIEIDAERSDKKCDAGDASITLRSPEENQADNCYTLPLPPQ